ncbi:hypothetical protein evm_000267 [Chilo suppressalis]|nr:hypothetical protein evm_000267 [Chilo suppressalis]
MEKRNLKKHEHTERKIEKKDRGDLKKANETSAKNNVDKVSNTKVVQPDSGDTVKAKLDKRANAPRRIVEASKAEERSDTVKRKEIESTQSRNVELDERRKIREKYMPKAKNPNALNPTDIVKKEIVKVVKNDTVKNVNVSTNNLLSSKIGPDRPAKKLIGAPKDKAVTTQTFKDAVDKDPTPQRRPVIKTVTSKNDSTKIYKAVTFVERDRLKQTALQVKLPDEYNTPKTSDTSATINKKNTEDTVEAKVEAKEVKTRKHLAPKKAGRKRSKLKRLSESPESLVRGNSPQTEVAKWAPASINKHTKPYYEAWVSTTLAAISKASKRDKLFLEKQHILQTFQRALATRPETPDLVYENFNDERYTGRIKVRQR